MSHGSGDREGLRWIPEIKPSGSGGARCPKCLFAGLEDATPPDDDWRVFAWVPADDAKRWLGEDHLDVLIVACRRCNYRWMELPADATQGEVH